MGGDARINSSTIGTQPTFSTSVDETATAQKAESPKQADIPRTSGETKSEPPRYIDPSAIRSQLAEFNLGGQLKEMILRGNDLAGMAKLLGTGAVTANSSAPAGTSKVDDAVARFTGNSYTPDAAAAQWNTLSPQEQREVASRLIENHPRAAAELAQQLGQASDPSASKAFWKNAESWMTQTVADTGYHPRLENARAFMDEVAMLGPAGINAKASANSVVMNIPFSDEFRALATRAQSNSVTEASRARAQLHLDNWRLDLSTGEQPSLRAMARRDPEAFVRNLDSLRGNKKEYDAAFEAALKQPSVDFTGRGERNGRTTDPYMENLHAAAAKYGSPTLKADFALRMHDGGSFRPGYEDMKKSRRDMMADPEVISILLNEKAEPFSRELRDMMKNDPVRAQNIMAAGVSGFTLDYHKAMSMNPPDTQAAKSAAYDLGLLLGEAKEAAKEAFVKDPAAGYNFLENVFKYTSKKLMDLIPGGNLAADVGKKVLEQLSDHFIKEATKFKEDASGKKIEDAIDKFVAKMFAATRDSFWTLRDKDKLNESVKQSPKLDAIKNEYKQFNEWLDGGYAAGRDSDNNSSRTR